MTNHKLRPVLTEIAIACLGGGLIFSLYLGVDALIVKSRSLQPVNAIQLGAVVPHLPTPNKVFQRTLLIATSKSCKYSMESVAFHFHLIDSAAASSLNIVVLVPDKESAEFMSHKFPEADVHVAKLSQMGIVGTPTIAVLDSNNRVQHLWSGQLPQYLQDTVLAQVISGLHILSKPDVSHVSFQAANDKEVGMQQPVTLSSPTGLGVEETRQTSNEQLSDVDLSKRLANTHLLDISPRAMFSGAGRVSAVNIPFDELKIRAKYELDRGVPWIIDCSHVDGGSCDMASYEFQNAGFKLTEVLDRNAMGATCQTSPTI